MSSEHTWSTRAREADFGFVRITGLLTGLCRNAIPVIVVRIFISRDIQDGAMDSVLLSTVVLCYSCHYWI